MNADYAWKLSKFGRLTSTRLRFDDDFADRLNYQFTGLLLFVFIGIIGIRQYVGKPIQCWTPQEFTRSWEEYAENYCWVASTYFVPFQYYSDSFLPNMMMNQNQQLGTGGLIPISGHRFYYSGSPYPHFHKPVAGQIPGNGRIISYYQWAPILLAIQSFMFYLPCLIWRLFASQSGFQIRRIMQLASEAAQAAPAEADAPGQPTSSAPPPPSESFAQSRKKLSLQGLTTAALLHSSPPPPPPSFAATKSVRTLARYLDMCFMRQRELRRAALYGMKSNSMMHSTFGGQINSGTPTTVTATTTLNTHNLSSAVDDTDRTPLNHPTRNTKSGKFTNQNRLSGAGSESLPNSSPNGMNCLDLLCCCGLFSWLIRKVCACCSCCRTKVCCRKKKYHKSKYQSKLSTIGSRAEFHLTNVPNSCHYKMYGEGFKTQSDIYRTDTEISLDEGTMPASNCSGCCTCCSIRPAIASPAKQPNQFLCCKYQGNFLVRLYLFVKMLYLSNIIGQIYLLEYYTGVQYNFYGLRVLYDLVRGRQWEESGHFPRVTFCDFEARKLAQSHYYTLQCVLPINMFLEKIYIFLWLWFFVVGIITFCSLVVWFCRIATKHRRLIWIQYQLITIRQHNRDLKSSSQFVENHLGPDGVFILRLICQNYGYLVSGDTVGELWSAYWQRRTGGDRKPQTYDQTTRIIESPTHDFRHHHPGDNRYSGNHYRRHQGQSSHPVRADAGITNESLSVGHSKKDKHRKNIGQLGFATALMATEMLQPQDRFPVPLIATSRKPPSIPSRSSSRYSERSRSRDRSESPPPIPQRSPGGGEYSFSDHQSLHDYGNHSDSHSTVGVGSPVMLDDNEGKYADHDVGQVEDRPIDYDLNEHEGELHQDAMFVGSYGDDGRYLDEPPIDDNIV